MKPVFVLASLAASCAFAKPLEKKWLLTIWDIQTVTHTVTGFAPAATGSSGSDDGNTNNRGGFFGGFFGKGNGGGESGRVTSAPAAVPVASSTPAPTPEPAPSSSAAPAPAPVASSSSAAPAPAPVQSSAPAAAPVASSNSWGSSPAAAAPASTQAVSSDYQQGILDAHNNHRRNSSVPNLTWSNKMASIAQEIAETCVYGHSMNVQGGGYGQNIGAGQAENKIPAMITNQMYNGEINYYPGYSGEPDMGNFMKWGHYSQIVWKGTTEVGCYTKRCSSLANVGANVPPVFTVCNYSPPGNVGGQYAANVLQPGNMPSITL